MFCTLYDRDYHQWLKQTAQQLRTRSFDEVDWDNLIEEIEDMGKSQRRALESYVIRLLEHLLKLAYWQSERDRLGNHWAAKIVNFRYQILERLQDSPSLKTALEGIYCETLPVAIKSVSKLCSLPPDAHISLEQALDEDWFPE
ncbi:DUF29 domain-containing protein [Gloeocapsa sp. PCC 73106]|uniref:DUF29 domain-containing protein n=1 Tax=Gloeocapsa sp. PCC 73106 TaxID=102232 RepID=UPI0002ABF638|nr:DUF29 domain-containing protein [Gloeocapsa sp. PCC 73106]ELR97479.1 protein of unknown function DUF29 [Gloeocapsa sp. PCC 73106]